MHTVHHTDLMQFTRQRGVTSIVVKSGPAYTPFPKSLDTDILTADLLHYCNDRPRDCYPEPIVVSLPSARPGASALDVLASCSEGKRKTLEWLGDGVIRCWINEYALRRLPLALRRKALKRSIISVRCPSRPRHFEPSLTSIPTAHY